MHTTDKSMFTAAEAQCMLQARAEQAFWSAKDQCLQQEMCHLSPAFARLRHQDQRISFWNDVTTDADVIEKVLTPLEHRIIKVATTECRCEHSTAQDFLCYTCRRLACSKKRFDDCTSREQM